MVMITNSFDKFPNEPTGLMYEQFGKIGLNPAPSANLDYTSFPSDYTGWTKSSNDATKVAFSSNRANLSIGEAQVDARAYGYDIGFDLDGDYCMDFELTMTNTPNNASGGQATNFGMGLAVATSDVNGEAPSGYNEMWKLGAYTASGSSGYTYVYNTSRNSGGTTQGGSDVNTSFPMPSSATNLRYGRMTRSGTTHRIQFFSDSDRATTATTNFTATVVVQTLRYIFIKAFSQGENPSWTGYLDNIKIYKGVTTPPSPSPKVKQHFIEYFSGKQLPSYWNSTNVTSGAMVDEVGGGYSITCGTGTWDTAALNFNLKRQYDPTSAIFIGVVKRTGSGYMVNGFNDGNNAWNNGYNEASISNLFSATYMVGMNGDGTTQSEGNMTQLVDTNFHVQKVECGSVATNYSIDRVLGLTRGTNKPIAKMQPIVSAMHYNSGSAPTTHVRYVECYNT